MFAVEIIMHEGVTAVYRSNVDLFFYVLGSQAENEVLSCLPLSQMVVSVYTALPPLLPPTMLRLPPSLPSPCS